MEGRGRLTGRVASIAFVGFGEAGFTIGNGLRAAGLERLFAFDIAADTSTAGR